jgi:LmbE family N-acetylglucosaminyl deacetylase
MSKILVIVAHPDDETFAMGGTMAKLSGCHEIHVLYCSGGETSSGECRQKYTDEVKEILGIHKTYHLSFPDQTLFSAGIELNNSIAKIVEEVKPEIVYTHAVEDLNSDHRTVHQAVMVACRPRGGSVKELYTFCISEWDFGEYGYFQPNTFIDIYGYMEKKLEAAWVYSSEIKGAPHPQSIDNMRYKNWTDAAKFCRYEVEEFKQVFRIV